MNTKVPTPSEAIVTLLRSLLNSDEQSDGSPVLPDESRALLLEWLQGVLVDCDALYAHIRTLQRESKSWRHHQPLREELASSVIRDGLGSLNSPELAKLALNPIALFDLSEEIDEEVPENWKQPIEQHGEELMQQFGITLDMLTGKSPLPVSWGPDPLPAPGTITPWTLVEWLCEIGEYERAVEEIENRRQVAFDLEQQVQYTIAEARALREIGILELAAVKFRVALGPCRRHRWPIGVRCLNNLAWLARRTGQPDQAWVLLQQARDWNSDDHALGPLDRSETIHQTAVLLMDQERGEEALATIDQALALRVEEDLHRARSRIVKGGILRRRLQFDQALQEFDQALHTRLQLLPPNHRDIGETYCMKGQLFEQQKLWDQAEHWFDLAKRSYSAPLSPLHRFGLARTHVFLAEVYKQTERIEEARKSAREALKLFCGSEELDPRQVKKAQEIAQDDVA